MNRVLNKLLGRTTDNDTTTKTAPGATSKTVTAKSAASKPTPTVPRSAADFVRAHANLSGKEITREGRSRRARHRGELRR